MIEKTLEVSGPDGIDARAAALIAQTAGKYAASVWIVREDKKVSGKSVMGLMSLTAPKGSIVTIGAEGEDELEAVDELISLGEAGFTEKA